MLQGTGGVVPRDCLLRQQQHDTVHLSMTVTMGFYGRPLPDPYLQLPILYRLKLYWRRICVCFGNTKAS